LNDRIKIVFKKTTCKDVGSSANSKYYPIAGCYELGSLSLLFYNAGNILSVV
jgi:hypothetical protein